MSAEPSEMIPVPRLAAAILLGALPPLLLYGLMLLLWLERISWDELLRIVGTLGLFALGAAILIGIPIAATVLRERGSSALRWAAAGAGTGFMAVMICGLWVFGLAFPIMLVSFIGPALIGLFAAMMVYGAIAALIARAILPLLPGA
jgi:hypothetical protein